MFTAYMQLLLMLMLYGKSHHWGQPLHANMNHTSLKDSLPNCNLDSTNLDGNMAIATPVSQRSASFTEQETSQN